MGVTAPLFLQSTVVGTVVTFSYLKEDVVVIAEYWSPMNPVLEALNSPSVRSAK